MDIDRKMEKIKAQLKRALTVGDLKKILTKYSDSTSIGIRGHFGEALLCDKSSVRVETGYLTPSGSWRDTDQKKIGLVTIDMPDRGPDPD